MGSEACSVLFDSLSEFAERDALLHPGHLRYCGAFGVVGGGDAFEEGGWVGRLRLLRWSVDRAEPVDDRIGDRSVFGDEVASVGPAMHIGVGEAIFEVVKVEVGEDGVFRSPEQQRRDVFEVFEALGDGVECFGAGVIWFEGDVLDEVLNSFAASGGLIWSEEAGPYLFGDARLRHLEGAGDESGRLDRGLANCSLGSDQLNDARCGGIGRLMDCGVREHDTAELAEVAQRPAERDRAAPVVRDGDDRAAQVDVLGEGDEIGDALGERTGRSGALREPHVEVVDSDCPNAQRQLCQQITPEVRPRRVAVNAEQGEVEFFVGTGVRVEEMERAVSAVDLDGLKP